MGGREKIKIFKNIKIFDFFGVYFFALVTGIKEGLFRTVL
jgi:uncharacterized membrane protein YeiH